MAIMKAFVRFRYKLHWPSQYNADAAFESVFLNGKFVTHILRPTFLEGN